MQMAMIGLGKMGGAMSRRLMKAGHACVVFARTAATREALAKYGATPADSLEDAVNRLTDRPRVIWLMLPAGEVTEDAVQRLSRLLSRGDIVIDGGNSFYKDDIRHAKEFADNAYSLRRLRRPLPVHMETMRAAAFSRPQGQDDRPARPLSRPHARRDARG